MVRQLRDLQANGPQTLTVATFASAGEPLLAPALTEPTTAAGNTVDVTVIEAEPDDALASLRSGGADQALVYHFHTRQPPGHGLQAAGPGVYIPLVDDHIRLLVPAGHPLASQDVAAAPELLPIAGYKAGATPAPSGQAPPPADSCLIARRSSDYRFMSALVSAGVGVALVSGLACLTTREFVTWPSPRNPSATSASTAPVGAGGTQQPTASSRPSVTKPPP